jgi:hypothetical protein
MEVQAAMSPFKGDSPAVPAERETRSGSFSNVTVSLCHCVTVSLCHCVWSVLRRCVTVSLRWKSKNPRTKNPRIYIGVLGTSTALQALHRGFVSLCHCVWSVLCRCVTVSLCYCVTVLLCHCVWSVLRVFCYSFFRGPFPFMGF